MAEEEKKLTTGTTTVDAGHAHGYQIDQYGNGKTVGMIGNSMAPHTHDIVNKKMSASGADNHIHRLASGRPGRAED